MKKFLARTFKEEFDNLIKLNLITCALCLTVICIGPAILALTGTLIKINDDRCDQNRIKEYFSLFKEKFVNGLLYEVCFALYVILLIMSHSIALKLEPSSANASMIVRTMVVLCFYLLAVVSVSTSIVLSSMKVSFATGLWNGICLAFGCILRSSLSALVVYGFLYLLYPVFWPVSAVFYVFLMISLTCALKIAFMWVPICRYLLDRDPKLDVVETNAIKNGKMENEK